MEEEDALPNSPQRSRAELVAVGLPLAYLVLQACPHIVQLEIAERRKRDIALIGEYRLPGCVLGDMTEIAADIGEGLLPAGDRGGGGGRLWSRRKAHECCEVDDIGGEVRSRTVAEPGLDEIGCILGQLVVLAARSAIPLVGEQLVGDT